MPTRNVFLTEQFHSFIASGIEEGRYSNGSEVVREGLRLLQQRDTEDRAKIEWLRGAVKEGIDEIERGEGIEFTTIDDLADHIHAIGAKAAKEFTAAATRAKTRPGMRAILAPAAPGYQRHFAAQRRKVRQGCRSAQ